MKDTHPNVARDLNAALDATRVISCGACLRTIVEYGDLHSKHVNGLPDEADAILRRMLVSHITLDCDHHGGRPYGTSLVPIQLAPEMEGGI